MSKRNSVTFCLENYMAWNECHYRIGPEVWSQGKDHGKATVIIVKIY